MTVAHQERVVPQDNIAAKRGTNTGCFSQEVRASPGVCADRNIRSSHGKCDHLRRDHKPIKGVFVPKPNQDISDLLQDFFLVNKTGVFHGKTNISSRVTGDQNRLFLEEVQASPGVFVAIKTSDFLAGNRTIYVVIAKPNQLF